MDDELEKLECSVKALMSVNIALDEILANISRYAYGAGGGTVEVSIAFDPEERTAMISFRDSGIPFDPLQKEEPNTALSAKERGIGGLGIFLVRKIMDAVEYRHEDGCNILTIE